MFALAKVAQRKALPSSLSLPRSTGLAEEGAALQPACVRACVRERIVCFHDARNIPEDRKPSFVPTTVPTLHGRQHFPTPKTVGVSLSRRLLDLGVRPSPTLLRKLRLVKGKTRPQRGHQLRKCYGAELQSCEVGGTGAGGNFNLDWVAEGTDGRTNLPSRLANMR